MTTKVPVELVSLDGGVVINEGSADADFRVESNGNANTLFVNGGKDYVSIGTASDFAAGASVLHLHQPDATSNAYLHITQEDGGATSSDGMSIGMLDGGANAVIRNRENGYLKFWTNNTARMTILSGGQVDIGGSETAHANTDDLIVGSFSGSHGIQINAENTANSSIFFGDQNSSIVGQLEYVHASNYLAIVTGGAQRARIDSDGLKFGSDSSAASALDDYEEGTWSASLRGTSGSAGTHAQSNVSAHYRKVGGLCFINAHFYLTNKGSYSGDTTLVGLPFTNTGSTGQISLGSFPDSGYGTTSGNVLIAASVQSGGAEVRFYEGARLDGNHSYSDVGTGYYVNIGGCYPVD